ncbi:MAG: STAS domain-containing protein [Planctomycetes bacterium]|nr:STAS domain-containing protein [Planctomycetota bacterium]
MIQEMTPSTNQIETDERVRFHALPSRLATLEMHGNDCGVLDATGLGQLDDHLQCLSEQADWRTVVIDLSRIRWITAEFLDLIDRFRRRLRLQHRRLSLWGVQPQCAHLLRLGGLGKMIARG